MEKFFIVKNENLINKYNEYKAMSEKVNEAFKKFSDEHGIEAKSYYQYTSCLMIEPTEQDETKFATQLKKDGKTFKKSSALSKAWVSICQEQGLETPYKPTWELRDLVGRTNRCRHRLFILDGKLYGSFEMDFDFELPKEHFTELKASEFWKIVEDYEEKK